MDRVGSPVVTSERTASLRETVVMRTLKWWLLPAVVSLVAAAFLVPPAGAQGRRCLAPNGTDDTEALQSALDRCSGATGRCTVRLCRGRFNTAPLRVGDFRGTLRGAGRERTVIQALPELWVNDNPLGYWQDDPLDPTLPPWPYLLQFVGGQGTVRRLAVEVPTPAEGLRPTQGWTELCDEECELEYELAGAILVTGGRAEFDLRQIAVVAGEYPESFFETTLLAGVAVRGLLLDTDPEYPSGFPVVPISGRFRIAHSTFVGMLTGVSLGELQDADVTIEGTVTSAFLGVDLLDANRSRVEVFENSWGVDAAAFNAYLNIDGTPSRDNTVRVSDNRGAVGSYFGFGQGIFFQDPWLLPEPGESTVTVSGNELDLGSPTEAAFGGIEVFGAGNLAVNRNTLRGRVDGVGVGFDQTTGCRAVLNNFEDLDATGPDLRLGLDTSECLAVIRRDDEVLDEGTNNRLFRLWW